jgi:long-chain acyl-CoA synthetase
VTSNTGNTGNTGLSSIRSPRPLDPGLPRYESLAHMFRAAVELEPGRTALISEGRRIRYRELGRAVTGLALELARLEVVRRRVVLLMPNSIEMDVALMAVVASGAQAAPANPFFTVRELVAALGRLDASALLFDPRMKEKAFEVARELGIPRCREFGPGTGEIDVWIGDRSLDRAPGPAPKADDPALAIFTGGSTGIPKGVSLTHRAMLGSILQHVSVWPLEFGSEMFLNAAPMFHIWGLTFGSWVPIFARSTRVLLPKFEAEPVARALGEHRITVFAGGPAPVYTAVLAVEFLDRIDLSALRYCPTGGAPCPLDLHREWLARTGCPLLEGWGMSEGAPFCLSPASSERRLLSVGPPVPETEIQVVDLETGERVLPLGEAGEVRVRGPQLMTGYIGRPEETGAALRDGWLYTGDIGRIDRDGFVFLVDRKKDMVIVGGYNVYPREVDEVLFDHPKIREAATVGRPDPRLGEVLVAFVALAAGEQMTEEEFFAYCSDALVRYKRPVEVRFVDRLPRTEANKIDRIALRNRAKQA